ncbi:hypothetical protein AGDE_01936 [Angomonas deanei]|nr:hypothetical protein AGDE_01936 [Angomonas deanei]|eukprot:EPY41987.1 hypothetical protein AGDE_01936 [Angomonas deanei]
MRDQADASRREKEKALIDTRSELSDTKRKLESLIEDVALYKGQVAKVEKEKREIAAQLEFAGRPTTELSDDEIHRALAVATIKKRADENKDVGDAPTDEGKEALDLYNALQWDEKWEKAQLEEAISSAALDLELAETRCQQMMEQVEKGRDTLLKLTRERDDLLEENVEMRGRLRHVQTVFAKQQLQTYRTAQARATSSEVEDNGLISFYVREIQYEPEILEQLGIKDYTAAVSLFLSLDGLLDYDTMLSPLIYSLQEPVDIHFQYADLDRRQVTITELQKTSFTFQLHAARGDASAIVAMCELSGTTLMTAREMSQEEVIELIAQDGTCVGRLVVEFTCRRLMLPVLLGTSPVEGNLHLSSAEVTAAMTALRSVRYLRVQVFNCEGLLSQGATPPQPYVFYTAHGPQGVLSCIRDTAVYPANKSVTTDPVFDAHPVDHRVIVDRDLIYFLRHGTITFVVFDNTMKDVQSNLGLVDVPLEGLLTSVNASIRKTEQLHPQGSMTFGISWVS